MAILLIDLGNPLLNRESRQKLLPWRLLENCAAPLLQSDQLNILLLIMQLFQLILNSLILISGLQVIIKKLVIAFLHGFVKVSIYVTRHLLMENVRVAASLRIVLASLYGRLLF